MRPIQGYVAAILFFITKDEQERRPSRAFAFFKVNCNYPATENAGI
jgi:hypothetical protein